MSYATISDIKGRLRTTDDATDDLITSLRASAIGFIEGYCERVFAAAEASRTFPWRLARRMPDNCYVLTIPGTAEFVQLYGALNIMFDDQSSLSFPVGSLMLYSVSGGAPYRTIDFGRENSEKIRMTGARPISFVMSALYGYSATAPPAVNEALIQYCVSAYRKTFSRSVGSELQSRDGSVGEAPGIGFDVLLLLAPYRRYS